MCLFTNINSWSSNSSHQFKIWKEICSLQIFASKIQWYKSSEIYEIIKYVFLLIVLVLWQKWKFNTAWTWRYFTIFLSDLNTDYYMTSFEIQGMQPFYTQVSGLNECNFFGYIYRVDRCSYEALSCFIQNILWWTLSHVNKTTVKLYSIMPKQNMCGFFPKKLG